MDIIMLLYFGDKELYDYIYNICPDISTEISIDNADKIIISEYSRNAISLVRAAEQANLPVLGILDGYQSVAEAFGGECIHVENCPEGKQELAVLDTTVPLHKNLGHVMTICRGNPSAINEDTLPDSIDCIARAETGEIISIQKKNSKIFAVNYYLNSTLTQHGDKILNNFLNM